MTKRRTEGATEASQPRRGQRRASPGSIVCPRRRRENEAEGTGDSSERPHLDGVELSRTDWPRTLDQRAKSYIALLASGSWAVLGLTAFVAGHGEHPRCSSRTRTASRQPASISALLAYHKVLPSRQLARRRGAVPAALDGDHHHPWSEHLIRSHGV